MVSRSSRHRGSEQGGERGRNALAERHVDLEPFSRLGHLALSSCEGVLVQPREGTAHGAVARCDQRRQRVEHPVDGVGWPLFQHLVPVLLDCLPGQDASFSARQDASEQVGSVL